MVEVGNWKEKEETVGLTFRSDVMLDAVCCLDKCSLADL